MYSLLTRLWQDFNHDPRPSPAPAAEAEPTLRWRCINAELGLAAWVAEPACRPTLPRLPRQPRSAKLLLAPEGSDSAALERLRQLAAADPDRLFVLPRWQSERLAAAKIPAEVALHLVLQRLRDDGWVGAATPTLLTTAASRGLADRYALRYRAQTQSLLGSGNPAQQRTPVTRRDYAWA